MQSVAFRIVWLFLCLVSASQVFCQSPPVSWSRVADDLELSRVSVKTGTFISTEVLFLRTSLRRYDVQVLRASQAGQSRSNIKQICESNKSIACINASFFDERGEPLGLVVSRGIQYSRVHNGGNTLTGIFEVNREGIKFASRRNFDASNSIEAIQSGPRLIRDGQIVQGLDQSRQNSRRSGICVDNKNRLLLFVVSSRLFGISLHGLQEILLHPEIACVQALNLDGGGSSQFFMTANPPGALAGHAEILIAGADEIPIALGLHPREGL